MKIKYIPIVLVLASFFAPFACYSQINLEWAYNGGGSQFDQADRMVIDAAGNIISVGIFEGTVDFDPSAGVQNRTSNGDWDVFIQKLSPSGSLIWVKSYGGTGLDFPPRIALDQNDNILLTRSFFFPTDFDPGPGTFTLTSQGSSDAYVLKLDSNGDFVWARQFAGNEFGECLGVATDANGNVYTCGSFRDTVDCDPSAATFNLIANGDRDILIHSLDSNGNFNWAVSLGGSGLDRPFDIAVDQNDDLYIAGNFIDSVDFNPSPIASNLIVSQANSADLFMLKLDNSGQFIWAGGYGSAGSADFVYDLELDPQGNVYAAGSFGGTVDLDPGPGTTSLTSFGANDPFVQKVDPNGSLIWAKQIGGAGDGETYAIAVDQYGGVYSTGFFIDTTDFDPGPGTFTLNGSGGSDAFVQKLDANGDFEWAYENGGASGTAFGFGITVDQQGAVIAAGRHSDPIDLDPGSGNLTVTSNGAWDFYLQKVSQDQFCPVTSSSITATACETYTSPAGRILTSSGNYTDTLVNANGCDSLISIALTINQSSGSTLTIDECGSYSWQGNTYTASGTYQDTVLNAAGCDSVLTLNLTINQATASLETASACDSYLWQGTLLTSSGTYMDTIQNATGCDSMMTLILTINQATASSETVTECGSYSWQGNTYTASGTYQDTLLNAAGCDSVLTLNLTINQATSSFETVSACDSYLWQGTLLTSSGNYMDTIPNGTGCDSVLTLNLILTQIDTSVQFTAGTLTANQTGVGASYQWIDCDLNQALTGETNASFTPTNNGNYAVVVNLNGCSDTSGCRFVTVVSRTEADLEPAKLYPNPNSGRFSILLPPGVEEAALYVYDTRGKTILHKNLTRDENEIALPAVSKGIYHVQLYSGRNVEHFRMMVE